MQAGGGHLRGVGEEGEAQGVGAALLDALGKVRLLALLRPLHLILLQVAPLQRGVQPLQPSRLCCLRILPQDAHLKGLQALQSNVYWIYSQCHERLLRRSQPDLVFVLSCIWGRRCSQGQKVGSSDDPVQPTYSRGNPSSSWVCDRTPSARCTLLLAQAASPALPALPDSKPAVQFSG